MIRVSVKLPLGFVEEDAKFEICKALKLAPRLLESYRLIKLSVDARNKENVFFNASYAVKIKANESKILARNKKATIYETPKYTFPSVDRKPRLRPVIVGAGPAGLFCAYILAKAGLNPLVLERGKPVNERVKSVELFWNTGALDRESNVQFGEGGAGTFSDGKLNTGISDKRIPFVLETFHKFGAPEEILWRQKPHIGTDKLRAVVVNLRNEIISLGGEVLFNCRMDNIITGENKIKAVTVTQNGDTKEIECDTLVLAIGHSARDTFENLYKSGLRFEQKPFAVGARIEHTQKFINLAQYGKFAKEPSLPVADYKLAVHLENNRGVYSFCMCPGGFVVNASSEENMIAVNGMSNFDRAGKNANSALLVNVTPSDFGSSHPLAGIEFQRKIERAAYMVSKSYCPPAQTVGSLLGKYTPIKEVIPTANVKECDFSEVLPNFVLSSLKEGIALMDKKIHGFAAEGAVLTAPETRSSSPVRIPRGEDMQSDIKGIYPCGEGAGYAGGITSSATDGIKTAEFIIQNKAK